MWVHFDMTDSGNGVAEIVDFFQGDPRGVLAYHNPNGRVLANGTGIEHFDATVLPVLPDSGCIPTG